jgi:hypothetical protein
LRKNRHAWAPSPAVERQVGALVLINGQVAGLELFDAASTWRKLSPKLIQSYALDAIDRENSTSPPDTTEGSQLIEALLASNAAVFPAVGEGEDVRLSNAGISGAALVAHGRAIHVSAFPAEQV